ncbi:TadE/TadG family type IV pilus assembly protein [Bradyrhizobium sp. 2TAF24]|uniref:TadE/TadG family type IV pilus assembly protein n=1 Tax=Bradyrhizobium sp. 2TAF24 TaxID=3233011 RepID=UPI003F9113EC
MSIFSSFRRFCEDRRGNVAVLFGIAIIPVLGCVGAAIDYSLYNQRRAKITTALDAAVLMATSKTEASLPADIVKVHATNMLNAQLATYGVTVDSSNFDIKDNASGRIVTGTASGVMQTNFMQIMGVSSMTVNGSATAQVGLPPYIDFYLLLDNSPSMGVAATQKDIDMMVSATPDQCAFACHNIYKSSNHSKLDNNTYYNIAKTAGVTMRIDVVRQATQNLMDTATATATLPNQFRMAIYTLGASCSSTSLTTIAPLTSNLVSAKTAANGIDLMTIPWQGYNNDQCTDFDGVFSALNGAIPTSGTGGATDPQKFVFFVSDGVADAYYPWSCQQPTTGGRCQEPLNVDNCTALKSRGIKIAVLYTTYLQLPTNGWYMNWIDPFNQGPFGPSPNSEIAQNMQACASPGFYFEVSPTQGISDAMNALFQRAVTQAHLTN